MSDEPKDETAPRWVLLGEHGPEIVILPVGTRIIPNDRLPRPRGGGHK